MSKKGIPKGVSLSAMQQNEEKVMGDEIRDWQGSYLAGLRNLNKEFGFYSK